MSKESADAALGKFAEAVNTGKFELFDQVVAPNCVDHDRPTDRLLALTVIECSSPDSAPPSPT